MDKKEAEIIKILVLRLNKGDRFAFNELFNIYSQRLYYFALGYLKSDAEAEDIVQDTFMKIWDKRKDINSELSFHSYIFKICFNNIQKKLIKQFKNKEFKNEFSRERMVSDMNTLNKIDFDFMMEYVISIANKLPKKQREVFILRKIEGYSIKEIAISLNISTKTVESHIRLALQTLNANFEKTLINK